MISTICHHFDLLNSDDFNQRNESILVICSLLEMHSWQLSIEERKIRYDYLDDSIINLSLDDKELKEVINKMCSILHYLLVNNEHLADSSKKNIIFGMIRSLEESPSHIALIPSLRLFDSCHHSLNHEIYNWFISALSKLLFISNDLEKIEKAKILSETNFVLIIEEKFLVLDSQANNHHNSNRLLENIKNLIDVIKEIMKQK
jgi:hypothetical protein